jgi:murein DD-endopeptidase MepM/ murein hydrolase activator NlpD
MFFRTVTALTLSLAVIGTPQIGVASEPDFEIEHIDLFADEMKSYQRSFIVTSTFYPSASKIDPMPMPQMVWPTDDKEISSDYGWRPRPCKSCSSDHKGIDFVPGRGEPVYAAMDGIVSRVENGGGFGQHVYIEHIANFNDAEFQNWQTIYAHMEIGTAPENLRVGSIVKAGEIIGTVGNTGTSTGAHLHFELLVEGENVDPEKYLLMYVN